LYRHGVSGYRAISIALTLAPSSPSPVFFLLCNPDRLLVLDPIGSSNPEIGDQFLTGSDSSASQKRHAQLVPCSRIVKPESSIDVMVHVIALVPTCPAINPGVVGSVDVYDRIDVTPELLPGKWHSLIPQISLDCC
jgi:hypothetical protein